jgi:4,5-DOPA dioxygenase extradiol
MPLLFLGHGSPANALQDNAFTRSLAALGAVLPKPKAVLCVSAHWLTRGTRVLCLPRPRTIHDFYGFPDDLYAVEYPAPGAPELAREVAELTGASCDGAWGFDHASWAVLRHVFPAADVPLIELSLDVLMGPRDHYDLAGALAPLRDRGVLIVGSGNIVHNLPAIVWADEAPPYPWALAFDAWVRDRLLDGDDEALCSYEALGGLADDAVPTNEHYLPLLYAAALRRDGEGVSFTHEGIEMGSVSMRCARIG